MQEAIQANITITITRDNKPIGDAMCGQFVCGGLRGDTLEDNRVRLQEGIYGAQIYFSPKAKRNVILLNESDTQRQGIYIRPGNYVKDAGGSILVGLGRGRDPRNSKNGAVWKSRDTLNALIDKCGQAKIKIIITSENVAVPNYDDDEKKEEPMNEIYIDRVYVIRCKVKSLLPKIGGLSHSALLFSTKDDKGWYVLEYSDERRTSLYPAQFDVLATYHSKYYEEIRFVWGGEIWTKQLNGSEPLKLWTVQKAKQVIDDAFKDEYAISDNKCCHIAQQIVRKAMGLTVDKEFNINNYPNLIKKGFSFIGY